MKYYIIYIQRFFDEADTEEFYEWHSDKYTLEEMREKVDDTISLNTTLGFKHFSVELLTAESTFFQEIS